MKVSHAIESYQKYHSFNSKKNTIKNYEFLFCRFKEEFGKRDLESIIPDEILSFLTRLTEGNNQTTKRNRYSRHAHLSTTQRYLGKVTDVEAMRWIENLYG